MMTLMALVALVSVVALVLVGLGRLARLRQLSDAGSERRRRSREAADRRLGIRRVLRRDGHRAGRARAEHQPCHDRERPLHEFPIAHVPVARCCACIRSSLCSFATSPAPLTNNSFAPPSTSLAVAFECTPIIPPPWAP